MFLPTSAPSHELVTESEVVTALCISLSENRTPSVVPTVRCLRFVLVFPCLDLLAGAACLILVIQVIQLTMVLVVESSQDMKFSKQL